MRLYIAILLFLFGTGATHAVELIEQPPLSDDIESLPRIAGADAVAARINAEFDILDRQVKADSAEILGVEGSWYSRSVQVLFAGPRFLVIEDQIGFYGAGAAHPNSGSVFLSYDLSTGEPVLWGKFLPPHFVNDDSSLNMDALRNRYRQDVKANGEEECRELVEDSAALDRLEFDVSLDATERALVLWPNGFSYAETSCANPAYISVDELRRLGAQGDLVTALEAPEP